MTRDEWAKLYDDEDVRKIIDYIAWWQSYKGYRSPTLAVIDVLRAGKSRREQLRRYDEKRKAPDSTFRPYAPLKASAKTRGDVKRAAEAEGVATVRDVRPWQCPTIENGRRCTRPKDHPDDCTFA